MIRAVLQGYWVGSLVGRIDERQNDPGFAIIDVIWAIEQL
jgi:hypothetical protein